MCMYIYIYIDIYICVCVCVCVRVPVCLTTQLDSVFHCSVPAALCAGVANELCACVIVRVCACISPLSWILCYTAAFLLRCVQV